jgi:hypothetical protein
MNIVKINKLGVVCMIATIILSGIVFGFMASVIVKQIKKAKNGESGCGCGCSGCSSAGACHGIKLERKK